MWLPERALRSFAFSAKPPFWKESTVRAIPNTAPCTGQKDFQGSAAYLAGPFVGAHLQTDCGLVKRFVHLRLGMVKVPPGPTGSHSCQAGTFVGSHMQTNDTLAGF